MFHNESLEYSNFARRKSFVFHKIPIYRRQLSINGAEHIKKYLHKENLDTLLLTDEFFLRFHETMNISLAPKGIKRVKVGLSVNEKDICLVMITLRIFGNLVLHSIINFTGVFERNKMKEYNVMIKSTVLFTQNH